MACGLPLRVPRCMGLTGDQKIYQYVIRLYYYIVHSNHALGGITPQPNAVLGDLVEIKTNFTMKTIFLQFAAKFMHHLNIPTPHRYAT